MRKRSAAATNAPTARARFRDPAFVQATTTAVARLMTMAAMLRIKTA